MMYFIAIPILVIIHQAVCALILISRMNKDKAEQIEREKLLRDWLFKSLYTIDKGVKLPTDQDKPLPNLKAKVFNPTTDPMSEFTGHMDDYYGKDKKHE